MKYLVGADNNTWRLPDAIKAAADGDTIEFQAGYSPVVDGIVISKSLHFEGKVTKGENGNQTFTNVITGRFNINQQANVTFENIWICYGVEKTNIINCKEQAEVSMTNCVLESTQVDGEVYPVLYAENNSKVFLRNTTIMENPKLYMKSYVENSKLELDNCVFQDCKLILDHVDFKMKNSTLQTGDGNTIHAVRCDVQIESSTIKGSDKEKEYPALWLEKSMATTESTLVTQPGFDAAVCMKNGSSLSSTGDEFTSIKAENAKVTLQNTKIRETAIVQNQSAACILGEWNILGENSEKIDLGIMNFSVVYGDTLTLNHVNTPNIRMTEDSILSLKKLNHNGGEVSELNIEAEDGCKSYYPKKDSTYETGGSNGNGDSDKPQLSAREQLNQLIGLGSVKREIDKMLRMVEFNQQRIAKGLEPQEQSYHSVFLGNPGTGKTTVARIVGEVLYQKGIISQKKFIEVSRSDLVAGYIGQTAKKTREVLESALGGVLFIDEAYSLSQGGDNDFGKEAIDEILKFMEDHRKDMVIIFAGYTKEMSEFLQMNSGLASRIPHTFDFEDYTPDEIVKIGLLGLHNASYEVDEAAYADLVKNNYSLTSDHSNGRWVRNLNEELIMVMSERIAHTEDADINKILQEDLDAIRVGNHGEHTLKSTEDSTEKVVADENGYAVPPSNN